MMKGDPRSRRARGLTRVVVGTAALVVVALTSTLPPSAGPGRDAAVLVSAAGNVVEPPGGTEVQLAAVYYHGFYPTKKECEAAVKAKLATRLYRLGGCTLFNQAPHKGEWQLWLDEKDCTDRVLRALEAVNGRPEVVL
ncbi:hypothetical protein GTU73_07505 [Rathayibacter sp. VKM Ac-2804]|uniref:hypothetical protein n=1 Tax=Rathayibacter sp. VKM Ac-2804 TaxID=2609257 RepID=UPI00132EFF29|nr:hypothetical protein [Rathayibacter sp. VKM Ac-2804]QHF23865.1 hypothetical protein GTU73_07505 [Rathayibacter sp. VKM Ac-2804]